MFSARLADLFTQVREEPNEGKTMNKPVVAIVAGTRPEVVKLAPVWHALRAQELVTVRWIQTGQHGEMANDMLRCFGVTPDIQLLRHGTSLADFTGSCRKQLDAIQAQDPWNLCVVQGDTESAFLGALSSFYAGAPVAHVEAGLRTYNLDRPFPEEGIRQMISRIASLHFAPTGRARASLLQEGVDAGRILVTGNTVVDAQHWICRRNGIRPDVRPEHGHILVTTHRREHWGEDMEQTFRAIAEIAASHPRRRVVFPMHVNPVIQRPARAILGRLPNVRLFPPLDYVAMQRALANAVLLLTDSGGLQEEAPTFGLPTLVLRKETERPEAIEAGCSVLVGPGRRAIVDAVNRVLSANGPDRGTGITKNPFGDGHAAERIASALLRLALGASAWQPSGSPRDDADDVVTLQGMSPTTPRPIATASAAS